MPTIAPPSTNNSICLLTVEKTSGAVSNATGWIYVRVGNYYVIVTAGHVLQNLRRVRISFASQSINDKEEDAENTKVIGSQINDCDFGIILVYGDDVVAPLDFSRDLKDLSDNSRLQVFGRNENAVVYNEAKTLTVAIAKDGAKPFLAIPVGTTYAGWSGAPVCLDGVVVGVVHGTGSLTVRQNATAVDLVSLLTPSVLGKITRGILEILQSIRSKEAAMSAAFAELE